MLNLRMSDENGPNWRNNVVAVITLKHKWKSKKAN